MGWRKNVDEKELNDWCKREIVPKIAENLKQNFKNIELKVEIPKDSYYISYVYFIDIKIIDENKHIHAVIKKPTDCMSLAQGLTIPEQFYNEILFYKKIANNNKQFPRCFYGYNCSENFENSVIVMENIESLGYKLCPSTFDLQFKYVIASVQELGRFHGLSYVMKSRDSKKFFNFIGELKKSVLSLSTFYPVYMNLIAKRPVKWLRKINYDEKFCDKIEYYMNNAFENFILNLIKPVEPLAVICHGDFTRNNILFRCNNGVLDSMLIDFAMIRYASPSIDLSTFLFYSVSKNDRTKRFNEILTAYHDALLQYLNNENIEILDCYKYDNFLSDYKRRVMFGYMIGLFFLPVIYGHCSFLESSNLPLRLDPHEKFEEHKNAGGENMSKQFGEMLIEVREFGGLDHLPDL